MASLAWNAKEHDYASPAVALVLFAAACAPVAGIAWLHLAYGIPIQNITRDVAAIGGVHPLAGFLSNLGILLWWTSAAIWIFSAALLRLSGARREASFALGFGLLSAFLTFDDFFQFHEALAPAYLGFDEKTIYAFLATALLAQLLVFSKLLLRSPFWMLAASFLMLGASAAVDIVSPWLWRLGYWSYLLEDGLKWLGIVAWSLYCISWCRQAVAFRLARG